MNSHQSHVSTIYTLAANILSSIHVGDDAKTKHKRSKTDYVLMESDMIQMTN